MQSKTEIDFVITWVDGSDEEWLAEKRRYTQEVAEDGRNQRYRDWGILQYWFRGVEQFAPWVRKIHFVTWGHLPKWLDTSNPKLHIVRHKDFIPAEYLPTFNSNAIEMFLHRIPGLAEHFVYFNDDVFPVRALKQEDFFIDGKPCDMLALQPIVAMPDELIMPHIYLNNFLVLGRHFDKHQNVKMQPGAYFHIGYPALYFFYNLLEQSFAHYTGFYTVHGPFPLCKAGFEEVWAAEEEELRKTASHKFRSAEDVSIYLMREWQKLSGRFVPRNVLKLCSYYSIESRNPELVGAIVKQKTKVLCLNDTKSNFDIGPAKKELDQAFAQILPHSCSFERRETAIANEYMFPVME